MKAVRLVMRTPRPRADAVTGVHMSLTGPVEDYLKAIYDLERADQPATTNEIADRLAVSPASVSGMMRRLAGQRLIRHEPYRGVRLTAHGRRAALKTLRRHRILECYLAEVLGYSWDRVHEEAEHLEHAASSRRSNEWPLRSSSRARSAWRTDSHARRRGGGGPVHEPQRRCGERRGASASRARRGRRAVALPRRARHPAWREDPGDRACPIRWADHLPR